MKRLFPLLLLLSALAMPSAADEIGFIEDYALAENRAAALEQLIPGTEAYYYFHSLHLQNTQQFAKVENLLADWIKRHGETGLVREIQNRQALLTYSDSPEKSLSYLQRTLNLQFNHQRELLDPELKLPSQLDPKLISRETLTKQWLVPHNNLHAFEPGAMYWLAKRELTNDQRRHLLQQLETPDVPNLVAHVASDLKAPHSGGFGSLTIHQKLSIKQLDELLKKDASLKSQSNFVQAYVAKLAPNPDVLWARDLAAQQAYIDRMWAFVEPLPPTFNGLKSQLLFKQLELNLSQGRFDKDVFLAYIQLPKHTSYAEPKYLQREEHRRFVTDLSYNFSGQLAIDPIVNDEPVVRAHLAHFFLEAASAKEFETWINDVYLKHLFAEVKILNGLGDEEQWSSLLPPEKFQQLKERVDISFVETNPEFFAVDDEVRLDVVLKNTPTLLIKVYEINAETYYRQNLREVDTDIELDGLTANHEETVEIDQSPLRQTKRQFAFPQIKKPGVYVVDFLANGRSSRALIRKGELRFTVDSTASGHVFRVYDGAGQQVKNARLWLAGHEYEADKKGEIRTPYSTNRNRQAVVISQGSQSAIGFFEHASEDYRLDVAFYVDRENLVSRQRATLLIRSGLFVNNTPIGLSILKDVELTIVSTTTDGVQSTQVVNDLELFEDAETKHEFRTPPRLSEIQIQLRAKVENISTGKTVALNASDAFSLNGIQATEKTEDLHLAKFGDNYVVELLGKSGETLPKRAVHLGIKHRDFKNTVNVTLQTDAAGRVTLGALTDVSYITASSPQGVSHHWTLVHDAHSHRQIYHAAVGDTIEVPWMGEGENLTAADFSLFEVRGGAYVADYFANAALKDGLIQISDLPRGDYEMRLKRTNRLMTVRVAEGKRESNFVLGESRILEVRDQSPLQIADATPKKDGVLVKLANATPFTRVHVFATRYEPAYSVFGKMSNVRDAEAMWRRPAIQRSAYIAGRNIGEEYQYILSRRLQQKYPGVMLARPELLLNPWAIRSTETTKQIAQTGEEFYGEGTGSGVGGGRPKPAPKKPHGYINQPGFASLDFLAQTSPALVNLEVSKNGEVMIPKALLSGRQRLHIVAVDPQATVYRAISLPEGETDFVDLRLDKSLDADRHFIQQNRVTIVPKGKEIVFRDATTSQFEVYDSLDDVYRLYLGVTENAHLAEFGFLMQWPKLTDEERRALYSKYACHELNFFLYQKDRGFYNDVVRPHLENKHHPTYLDNWQLGADLGDYRKPWSHQRLNTVEQILLGRRIAAERPFMQRQVEDRFALLPPQTAQLQLLFDSAVASSSLEADYAYGIDDLKDLERDKKSNHWGALRQSRAMGPASESAPAEEQQSADRANNDPGDFKPESPGGESKSEQGGEKGRDMQSRKRDLDELNKRIEKLAKKPGEGYYEDEALYRKKSRRFYVELDSTKEWVENNYYKLPIEQQLAELVGVNRFWRDYAQHPHEQPFLTEHLADVNSNFTEIMFALSVLDLPFEADEPKSEYQGPQLTIQSPGPMVVFHQEIQPAEKVLEESPILVRQRFFRHGDRYSYENGQQVDKFVSDEFVIHQVYGCQIVVTNPTSSLQKLDLLLQIPSGAVPVLNAKPTSNVHIDLQPFHTQTVEYHFYFPLAGEFTHYPVNVSNQGEVLAFAASRKLNVVNKPTKVDANSWAYVSQHASDDDVLKFLEDNNVYRLELAKLPSA